MSDDGGPANGNVNETEYNESLRDKFAGQAMAALIKETDWGNQRAIAKLAYTQAQAMIDEKRKRDAE